MQGIFRFSTWPSPSRLRKLRINVWFFEAIPCITEQGIFEAEQGIQIPCSLFFRGPAGILSRRPVDPPYDG
jgi:hypothetical protein